MNLKTRKINNYTYVLIPVDTLSFVDIDKIDSTFEDLIDESQGKLIIDLKDIESIDSKGLAFIMVLHKQCLSYGGQLALINVNDEVMYVFNLTGFDNVLRIISDENVLLTKKKETA